MQYARIEWPYPVWGLYTELDSAHIPPNALSECVNLYYVSPTSLRSRGGIDYKFAGSEGNAITRMLWWDRIGELVFANDNAQLYRNGTIISGTAENVTDMVAFGSTSTPDLIVAESLGTQTHTLHTYDGTTYEQLTGNNVPKCQKLMVRFERLWATCNPEHPSRIYYSDVSDATQWGGRWGEGGYFDVAPGQDGDIVDWIDIRGVLWVLKERGVYMITGDDPDRFEQYKIAFTSEAIEGTVADCVWGVLYATQYGVVRLGREFGGDPDQLYRHVATDLQAVLSNAKATFSPEIGCYLIVSGSDTVWVSNVQTRPDVWTQFVFPVNMTAIYYGNGLWFGDDSGNVYQYDQTATADNTGTQTAFDVYFKTGDWDLGGKVSWKNVRYIEGLINARENATCTVELFAEGSANAMLQKQLQPGDRNLIPLNNDVERLAMKVTYTNRTGPVYFGGATVYAVGKGEQL